MKLFHTPTGHAFYRYCAVDDTGRIVFTNRIDWPHADPPHLDLTTNMAQVAATIEEQGLRMIEIGGPDRVPLPNPSLVRWDDGSSRFLSHNETVFAASGAPEGTQTLQANANKHASKMAGGTHTQLTAAALSAEAVKKSK